MIQHQISHVTKYNRYPEIFNFCSKCFNNKVINILSFGCSKGDEVKTLKNLYFKDSYIDGVDISREMIEVCKKNIESNNINFYDSEEFSKLNKKYDLIFCMSVLCRWEQTEKINDCSSEFNFDQFEEQIKNLDKLLNKLGLLVVYNSNFRFSDSSIYNRYSALNDESIKESGFVHKFYKNNIKIPDCNYKECIFQKKW